MLIFLQRRKILNTQAFEKSLAKNAKLFEKSWPKINFGKHKNLSLIKGENIIATGSTGSVAEEAPMYLEKLLDSINYPVSKNDIIEQVRKGSFVQPLRLCFISSDYVLYTILGARMNDVTSWVEGVLWTYQSDRLLRFLFSPSVIVPECIISLATISLATSGEI